MISGATQADCAVLVLESQTNVFERSFETGTTKEHLILARSLGVKQIIVAVNKFDMVQYKEARYDFICSQVDPFLKYLGFSTNNIHYLPTSGFHGINVDTRDTQVEELKAWYNEDQEDIKKKGRCLVEIMDSLNSAVRPHKRPVRACIYSYFNRTKDGKSTATGDCVHLKIESGIIKEKDNLLLMPHNILV